MAYTTVHPIRATLGKALDYICNPEKTANKKYISSVNCQHQVAEHEFRFTRNDMNENITLLAFHAIQSFKKGEVTPEQGHEIGMQTMKEFLKDEYEFIITTHVDTGIIHNHIIINSVNMINGKSFSREHNRKEFAAWKEMKKYSDKICAERGLSVIQTDKGKGMSHYEWEQNKAGVSWKQQLKNIIDETIKQSDNFEDFLSKLRAENIEVKYLVVTTVSRTEKTTPEITKRTDEHGNIVITVGDVNDDGRVSGLDAAIIARKLAEGRSSDLNKWAADYNGDGKVTALDCAEIARFLAKLSIIEHTTAPNENKTELQKPQ